MVVDCQHKLTAGSFGAGKGEKETIDAKHVH